MNKKLHALKYISFDFLTAGIAWTLFFVFRKIYIESQLHGEVPPIVFDNKFYISIILIPLFWLLLYYLSGYYKKTYRKSRLQEFGQTFFIVVLGVLLLFFILILDDEISNYKNYYFSFAALLSIQFVLTYIPRLIITTITNHKIHNRRIGFNTLLIGGNGKACEIYKELESQKESSGHKFVGFINIHDRKEYLLSNQIKHLGSLNNVKELILEYQVEEVIIAIESSEHEEISKIINKLEDIKIDIKIVPNMYDILTGIVKMSSIFGAPLIQISHDLLPVWQENLKRILDVSISLIAIILLTPLYIILALSVKLSSKGPFLYNHERIGIYGKPFIIYKFRSMYCDAEKSGPALSSEHDPRITPLGRLLRKTRLDEIPQFYNVLIGDMSLVGPRPERQFFIDLIVKQAPHYIHLQKVRPGITSWGQVKFGYAENVAEMIKRLRYDIMYIENMSLFLDFKIMIHTINILFRAKGK